MNYLLGYIAGAIVGQLIIYYFFSNVLTRLAEAVFSWVDRRVGTAICQHCGDKGATDRYTDTVLGCEYEVHTKCKPDFIKDIELEVGRYFYGE